MELKDYKNVFVFAEQREGNIQSVARTYSFSLNSVKVTSNPLPTNF